MKILCRRRHAGILFLFLILIPNLLILPNKDILNSFSGDYESVIRSSNDEILVTCPVTNFDNDNMILNITGVYASLDSIYYNGISNPPELAEYTIYREVDDSVVGENGSLIDSDGDEEWTKTSINVIYLNPGVYYVRAVFRDNGGSDIGISPKSNRFFVLGNLSVSAATVSYIGDVTQKINITEISVANSSSLDVFIYTIFENELQASTSISGTLNYEPISQTWKAINIDVSTLPEGSYFVLGYFEDHSEDKYGLGNISASTLDIFTINHEIIISGIFINYTANFQQTLNITVLSANSTYEYHSYENISHANYRFYFRNNQTTVTNPNLADNLTWTGSNWQGLALISKLPKGEYYVVVNFADPFSANSKGSKDTTNFTVIHILNVSTPIINYINNMNQILNISCYANSSYYYHQYFNSSDCGNGYYRIYRSNGSPTTITGDLEWNGITWTSINADVSLLPVGSYRIKTHFSTYYNNANSSLSNSFNVTHIINITSPTVIFNNNTKLLNILHVTARSSYSTHGYLTNLTAQVSRFEIFNTANQSTGISGELSWNGSEWQVINFAIVSLGEGSYYVKLYFNDTQTSLTEISSTIFIVEYPKEKMDWFVIVIIVLIAMAAAIVLFWTFFTETPAKRGKEP